MKILDKIFKKQIKHKEYTNSFISQLGKRLYSSNNTKEAMHEMFSRSPFLYQAVDIIARSVASTKFYLQKTHKDGSVEIIKTHDVLDLLHNPNPLLLGYMFMYATQGYLELSGEIAWIIERDNKLKPRYLWPIPGTQIRQLPRKDYPYYELVLGDEIKSVPITEIVYIKTLDLKNIYGRGLGKAQVINDELSIHELSTKQINQYFYNDATPSSLIGLKGVTAEQAQKIKQAWLANNQGWVNKYLPHFIGTTDIVFHKLQDSFKDMELNELRKDAQATIMQFFGIPYEIYGDTKNGGNRANAEIAETNFAKQVVKPRLEYLEYIINEYLLPEYKDLDNTAFKFENIVPRDKDFALKAKQQFSYAFNLNEIRQEVGAQPIPEFNEIYPIPQNIKLKKFDELTTEEQEAIKSLRTSKAIISDSTPDAARLFGVITGIPFFDYNDEVMNTYVNTFIEVAKNIVYELDPKYNFTLDKLTAEQLISDKVGEKIRYIDDTLQSKLREALIRSIEAREAIPEIVERLDKEVFLGYKSGYELERIARTESIFTVNSATLTAYQTTGVKKKRWIATPDSRTRDTHQYLNNQVVDIDANFVTLSGDTAPAPGQFSSAGENINCRCTIVAEIPGKIINAKEHWTKQNKKAEQIEPTFSKVFANRFSEIQKYINSKLKSL